MYLLHMQKYQVDSTYTHNVTACQIWNIRCNVEDFFANPVTKRQLIFFVVIHVRITMITFNY